MRKIPLWTAAVCALAFMSYVPATADSSSPPAPATALAGKMMAMQFLVGSWKCDVKVSAMMGQPAFTDQGVLTYDLAPGISGVPSAALHSHVTAKDYAADTYSNYDDMTKTFWMNTIDEYANVSSETSTDGKVFSGSSVGSHPKMQIRDTFSRPATNTIRDLQEYQVKGGWSTATDSTCTRM